MGVYFLLGAVAAVGALFLPTETKGRGMRVSQVHFSTVLIKLTEHEQKLKFQTRVSQFGSRLD